MKTRLSPGEPGRGLLQPGHDVGVGHRLGEDRPEHSGADGQRGRAGPSPPTAGRGRAGRAGSRRAAGSSALLLAQQAGSGGGGRAPRGRDRRPPRQRLQPAPPGRAGARRAASVSSGSAGDRQRRAAAARRAGASPRASRPRRRHAATSTVSADDLGTTRPARGARPRCRAPAATRRRGGSRAGAARRRRPGRAGRRGRRPGPSGRTPWPGRRRGPGPATCVRRRATATSVPVASSTWSSMRLRGPLGGHDADLRAGHGRAGPDRCGAEVAEHADAAEKRQGGGRADDLGDPVVATQVEGKRLVLVGDERPAPVGSPRRAAGPAASRPGGSTSRPSGRFTTKVREASKRVKRSLAAVSRDDGVRVPGLVEQVQSAELGLLEEDDELASRRRPSRCCDRP